MVRFCLQSLFAVLLLSAGVSQAAAQGTIPVNIESVPPGATVYLDTTDGAPLGTTPLSAIRIARGAHTLIFRLDNYEEARLTITVARRRETFRAVLRALGTIEVSPGNAGANGGTVYVDGAAVGGGTLGSLPIRVPNLPPGRHQVRVERSGFVTFEQWVEVAGGQTVRVTAMLEAVAPDTGSILVSCDVAGAAIFIDGRDTGRTTTTVLDDIPIGTHTLEIRMTGMETFSQTVLVQRGQRAEVHATIRPAAPTAGRLTVIISPAEAAAGATVLVDSEPMPAGVRSRSDLEPGTHVVQVVAPGYVEASQTVTITAGQSSTVEMRLEAVRGEPTDINLQASVPGATIVVDGESHPSPYVADETEGGTHSVVVRADGYQEVAFTCTTVNGAGDAADCQRTIELEPLQVRLRAEVAGEPTREPATLYIDDVEVSTLPYEGRIAVGSHVFEVRAPGYETYRQQVVVEYGEGDITIGANMVDSSEAAAAGATTHSAIPIPMNHPMIDVSIGWPYLAELRLNIGLHELVDAGFSIRTFGRITEFEGRARFGVRVLQQLGFGVQARFGGGIGPNIGVGRPTSHDETMSMRACTTPAAPGSDPRTCSNQDLEPNGVGAPFSTAVNTAFFSVEGNMSLLLEPIATVTLWLGFDMNSDQYYGHPHGEGAFLDYGPSGDVICTSDSTMGIDCVQDRQDQFRVRLGGAAEFNITRNWGFYLIFEGILWQPPDHRRLLSDLVGEGPEIRIYPRLGATYRF